jgi:S1-C subfamily serine protease
MTRLALRSLCVILICVAGQATWAASLHKVFESVNPSVVIIHTQERQVAPQTETGMTSVAGLGSGFLISEDGLVMTAAHVVQVADAVMVEFISGEMVEAKVVASEVFADVALLQLISVPKKAVVAKLGDSDAVQVGDEVFVIGAPYGIGHTLTVGHISGRHRPNTRYSMLAAAELLQTDAAINQGNSGGPMFNMDGEAVGIVSHILSQSGGFEGLGFVVTTNMAQRLLMQEESAWWGMQGYFLHGDLAEYLNIPPPGVALLVQQVAANSPAEEVGLRGGTQTALVGDTQLILGGDIIMEIMGIPVAEMDRAKAAANKVRPGQTLRLTILRGGKKMNLVHKIPHPD